MTVFKKIIDGEIPCYRVYENNLVLAFLDVNPIAPGHTLLIPKEEAPTLDQLSDESAAALGKALPVVARAVQSATGILEYNVLQNNGPTAHQAVFHVHFHIIPRPNGEVGLGVGWRPGSLDPDEARELAANMAAAT